MIRRPPRSTLFPYPTLSRSEEQMSFSRQASVLCAASVAGCGQSFGRVLGRGSFFGGGGTLARLPLRQFDLEGWAAAFAPGNAVLPRGTAHHRLNAGETEAGAQTRRCVVW